MPPKKQTSFEWTYPATRQVSRSLRLPQWMEFVERGKPRRVNGLAVRSVLNVIEDRAGLVGWCTLGLREFAGQAHVSRSQIPRCTSILDREGLIIIQGSRYRPYWDGILESKFCELSAVARRELQLEVRREIAISPKAKLIQKRIPPLTREQEDELLALIDLVPRIAGPDDWDFAAKMATLCIVGVIPIDWFYSAVESFVRQSNAGFGYFVSIFRNRLCAQYKVDIADVLRSVCLPIGIRADRSPQHVASTDQVPHTPSDLVKGAALGPLPGPPDRL